MKKRSFATKLTAALLTGAMMLSMSGMNAFAGEQSGFTFTKILDVSQATASNASKNNAPVGTAVKYTVIPHAGMTDKNGLNAETGVVIEGNSTLAKYEFTGSETLSDGKLTVSISTDYFDGVKYSKPGIYRYEVIESVTNPDVTFAKGESGERILDVYVKDNGNGEYKPYNYIMFEKNEEFNKGTFNPVTKSGSYVGVTKSTGFENKYETYDLVIEKLATGDMADKNQKFDFTVTFDAGVDGKYYKDYTVKVNGEEKSFAYGKVSFTTSIKSGEEFEICGLPSCVSYNVTETENEISKEYTTSYSVNGETTTSGKSLDVSTIGKKDNEVLCTNTRNAVTPTGIVLTYAPYIALVAAAGVFAVLFLRKKHEEF